MIKSANKDTVLFFISVILAFLTAYLIQMNLAVALLLISLAVYLKLSRKGRKNYNFLNLIFLFVINFACAYFILRRDLPVYYIPFSLVPMLATLLFNDLELSLLVSLANSVTVAGLCCSPFQTGLLSFASGLSSSLLIYQARRRITIIRSGIIVGTIQVVVQLFNDHLWIGQVNTYAILALNGIVSGIIVLGVLPIFEYLFRTVTNISLLELADFNHPLLQRMVIEAPGTYHHSLIVGNLSENACRAVGANALLARIGAYYHDIGKLEKSEYFSENQEVSKSKHDALSPSMSKMIIMNHVKEGLELAKKYKLSPRLVDFILMHHGRSLVYYFYRKALESIEEDHEVKEEGFRYPGPKPNTRETAIVLLADSVEAATRALREPMPAKIEEVVHKVINNKFIDGQLDECELTLKDLEKISTVFIRILGGIYHSRTGYPEESKGENNNKRLPKEDPRLSDKDKKDNS